MDPPSTSSPSTPAVVPPTADASPSSCTSTEPLQRQPSPPQQVAPSTPSTPQNPSTHHISEPSPSPAPEPRPQATPTAVVFMPGQQNSQSSSPQSHAVHAPWRGGLVLGIPASRTRASRPAAPSPARLPNQRMQGISPASSTGTGSCSQVRPAGIGTHHEIRPTRSSSSSHFPSQGLGQLRPSALSSPALRASSTEQNTHPLDQTSISLGSQAKPPLPRPIYRPQFQSPSLLARSQIQQKLSPLSVGSQPSLSQQQKLPTSNQHQDHSAQQLILSRTQISASSQNQIPRPLCSMMQIPRDISKAHLSRIHPGTYNKPVEDQHEETEKRILSKRSIQKLVNQIDPSEKLDPEVEDILLDIGEDFVDSITTFGCSLAKHRKSDTLEAKDILLHLERSWDMTVPLFVGDEVKMHRKQGTTDIHLERLSAIKKSAVVAEVANTKSSVEQAAVNSKNNREKLGVNVLGSPYFTLHKVA